MKFDKIRYNNKYYAVINIGYKDIDLPIVVDWQDFHIIRELGKSWKCNRSGFISCLHRSNKNNNNDEVFLHEVIMALKQRSDGKKRKQKPIIHINRIGFDNRRENLIYDSLDKNVHKNLRKKSRTIVLPEDSGIDVNEIPTYVWYMKPDKTHGERFMVEIDDINWKTTSSKELSLRYKLEEAKKYLRELKKNRPDLFEDYSMNGDYTKVGKELLDSYYTIIHKAGYTHINRYVPRNNTNTILRAGSLTRKEQNILKDQNDLLNTTDKDAKQGKRRILDRSGALKDSGITQKDLPKYSYYRPAYENRGDYFVVENHPKQNKTWRTTTSKQVSTYDKYQELLAYVNNLDNDYSSSDTSLDTDSESP